MTEPVPTPAPDLRTRLVEAFNSCHDPLTLEREALRETRRHDGHLYHHACAVCRGDLEELADATLAVVESELARYRDENEWLSEACRLTVREAASMRAERDRLLRDATPARQKLMCLIGGDWTVEPSLTDLATYATRFWGDDRRDLTALREEAETLRRENDHLASDNITLRRERDAARTEYEVVGVTLDHATDRLSDMVDDAGLARPDDLADALDSVYLLIGRAEVTEVHVRNASLRSDVRVAREERDVVVRNSEKLRTSMIRDLHAAVFDGSTLLPDRPLDTVWEYLLGEAKKDAARASRGAGNTTPIDWARQLYEVVVSRYGRTDQAATLGEELADLVRGWGAVNTNHADAAAQIEAVIAGLCTGQDDANGHIIYFIDDVGSPAEVANEVLKLITSPGWGAVTNPTDGEAEARKELGRIGFLLAERSLHDADEPGSCSNPVCARPAGPHGVCIDHSCYDAVAEVDLYCRLPAGHDGPWHDSGTHCWLVNGEGEIEPSPAAPVVPAPTEDAGQDASPRPLHPEGTPGAHFQAHRSGTGNETEGTPCGAIEGGMGVDCHLPPGHDGWHNGSHTPFTDGTESIGYPFRIQWPRNEYDRCALPAPAPTEDTCTNDCVDIHQYRPGCCEYAPRVAELKEALRKAHERGPVVPSTSESTVSEREQAQDDADREQADALRPALPGPPCETCQRPRAIHVCRSCSPDGVTAGGGCHNCRQTGWDQTPCLPPAVPVTAQPEETP